MYKSICLVFFVPLREKITIMNFEDKEIYFPFAAI
jgi:hypothetical protein